MAAHSCDFPGCTAGFETRAQLASHLGHHNRKPKKPLVEDVSNLDEDVTNGWFGTLMTFLKTLGIHLDGEQKKFEPQLKPREEKAEVIWEEQKSKAEELLAKFEPFLSSGEFTQFTFYIALPPSKSLFTQTSKRLTNFFNQFSGIKEKAEAHLFLASTAERWANLPKTLLSSPDDCLNLVIQDECHWGAHQGGQAAKVLNDPELLQKKNIFVLHVSATAFTFIPMMTFDIETKKQIVDWGATQKDYFGANEYSQRRNASKTAYTETESTFILAEWEKQVGASIPNAYHDPLRICLEYFCALCFLQGEAEKIPEFLKEAWTSSVSDFAATKILHPILEEGAKKLAVIRVKDRNWAHILRKIFISNLKNRAIQVIINTQESPIDLECLEDFNLTASVIMIVVKKLQMGDTLPHSTFSGFDLRTRYHTQISSLESFVQDFGRAFGWKAPDRAPFVALGAKGRELLKAGKGAATTVLSKHFKKNVTSKTLEEVGPDDDEYVDFLNEFFLQKKTTEKKHMSYQLANQAEALSRRFLLTARPQIGKTGTFLWLLHRFSERLTFLPAETTRETALRLLRHWKEIPHDELAKKPFDEWTTFHRSLKLAGMKPSEHYSKIFEFLGSWPDLTGKTFLDMGAGTDDLFSFLSKTELTFDPQNYTSVDIHSLEDTNSLHPFLHTDMANTGQPDSTFDFVFMVNSLYDQHGYRDHISEAVRVLKAYGFLVLIYPKSIFRGSLSQNISFLKSFPLAKRMTLKYTPPGMKSTFYFEIFIKVDIPLGEPESLPPLQLS